MKTFLAVLIVSILSVESAEPDVRLSLSDPKFKRDPNFQVGDFEFVATVTNHSKTPVWLRTLKPNGLSPYYHAFVRPTQSDEWRDIMTMASGIGLSHFKLAPEASLSFTARVPADKTGNQYRAEILVYPAESGSDPYRISSKHVTLPHNGR